MSGNRTIQSSPFTTLKDELIDVHHSSLYLGQLCLSWEHHDVVIMSSEGTKIPAHKLILLSRSDYFKNMFASSAYSDENPVILPYSTECIKQILRFLYSGKINLSACHFRVLLELMDASRMMLMYSVSEDERGGIADYIEYYIIAQLFGIPEDDYYTDDEEEADVDLVRRCRSLWELKYGDKDYTAVEILNYSIANVFPTLMNASICFLKDIALQFLWRQSIFNLSFPALSELLKLDALADSAEVGIFSAVERWLNFSPDHMDQKVRILQLIRFDQMSVTEMFHTVKPSGLLESKELLDIMECIINKDELKVENGRHIIGRRGCMEKVSQVPMWIREISITTSQRCVFMGSTLDYWRTPWAAQILYTENSQLKIPDKSLTELGFSLQLLNGGYKEYDDEDYIPEEDSELETDSSTDDEDGTEDDEDGTEDDEDGIEVGEEDGKSGLETDFSTDNEDEIEEDKEDWKAGLETDNSTDGEHEIEVGEGDLKTALKTNSSTDDKNEIEVDEEDLKTALDTNSSTDDKNEIEVDEEDLKTALETNSSTDDKNEIEVDEEDRKAVMETNSSTNDKNEIEMGEEDLKAGLETNSPTDDDESEVDEEDWKAAMETNSPTDDEDEIEMGKKDWKAGLESYSSIAEEDDSCYQAFTSFVFGNNIEEGEEDGLPRLESDSSTDKEDDIEEGEEDLKGGLESDSSIDEEYDIEEGEEDGLPRLESDSSIDEEDDIEEGEEDLKGGLESSIDDLFQYQEELDDYIKQRDLL